MKKTSFAFGISLLAAGAAGALTLSASPRHKEMRLAASALFDRLVPSSQIESQIGHDYPLKDSDGRAATIRATGLSFYPQSTCISYRFSYGTYLSTASSSYCRARKLTL